MGYSTTLIYVWIFLSLIVFILLHREDVPEGQPDACRIHGSLEVSKVAGNFHVTAGK